MDKIFTLEIISMGKTYFTYLVSRDHGSGRRPKHRKDNVGH